MGFPSGALLASGAANGAPLEKCSYRVCLPELSFKNIGTMFASLLVVVSNTTSHHLFWVADAEQPARAVVADGLYLSWQAGPSQRLSGTIQCSDHSRIS